MGRKKHQSSDKLEQKNPKKDKKQKQKNNNMQVFM